jgi:hypothetical protein
MIKILIKYIFNIIRITKKNFSRNGRMLMGNNSISIPLNELVFHNYFEKKYRFWMSRNRFGYRKQF